MALIMSKLGKFSFSFNPYLFGIAGIFFVFSFAAFLYEVVGPVRDAIKMRDWLPMTAEVLEVELAESWGDGGSVSYQTFAAYEFVVDGKAYWNDRVSVNSGFDNLGQYQINIFHRLNNARERGLRISGWYNPDNPAEAVIDRGLRWIQVVPLTLFCLPVMFFAFIVMCASVVRKRDDEPSSETASYLFKKEWKVNGILSEEHRGQLSGWLFIMLLCSVVIPCLYIAVDKLTRGVHDLDVVIYLLFAVSLLYVLYRPLKSNIQQVRYGKVPLVVTPFPGILGRIFSGYLQFPKIINVSQQAFHFSLQQVRTYRNNQGEGSGLQHVVNWETQGQGHLEVVNGYSRVYFAIQVEGNLPESKIEGDEGDWWRLNVEGRMQGITFTRTYEVPIFCEGYEFQEADTLNDEIIAKVPVGRLRTDYSEELKKLVSIEELGTAIQFRQKILISIPTVMQLVGGVIASAIGIALFFTKAPFFFAVVFAIAGLLPLGSALSRAVRCYQTYIGADKVTCRYSWMWVKHGQKVLDKSNVHGVYMTKYAGYEGLDDRKKEYFDFYLVGNDGYKVKIISDLLGREAAKLFLEKLEVLCKLKSISALELKSLQERQKNVA
ncbi:hypothetical protein FIU95_09635 [Microbulbifer sp. THAF38]|nr:hypothetical protein FIU95_09635 [Microbulbifer sp. THAF38]